MADLDTHRCPICSEPFKPGELCATDIEMGTCHAACLDGSPVVDLDTGEETGGEVDTYLYSEVMDPPAPAVISRGWQTIDTAPKNVKVLAAYQNEIGNWRIVTACYHTQLEWSDEYGDHEQEFAPVAWYEENDSSEVIYQTSRKPTHWQPLPAPPAIAASEGSTDA